MLTFRVKGTVKLDGQRLVTVNEEVEGADADDALRQVKDKRRLKELKSYETDLTVERVK